MNNRINNPMWRIFAAAALQGLVADERTSLALGNPDGIRDANINRAFAYADDACRKLEEEPDYE